LKLEETILKQANDASEAFAKKTETDLGVHEIRLQKLKADSMEEMNEIATEIAIIVTRKIAGINTDIKNVQSIVKSLNHKEAA
jgi:hypothetical protein